MAAYVGGVLGASPEVARIKLGGEKKQGLTGQGLGGSGAALRAGLERLVRMPLRHTDGGRGATTAQWKPQAWQLYDTFGHRRAADMADVLAVGREPSILLLFVGGVFIHPGVRIGFKRELPMPAATGGGSSTIVTMSLSPLVFSVTNFLEVRCL